MIPNREPDHDDRLLALDWIRHATGGDASNPILPKRGPRAPDRVARAARALEIHGLARLRRDPDGMPVAFTLRANGQALGEKLNKGGVAIFPADGRIRVIDRPSVCRAGVGVGDRPDLAAALDAPTRITTEAPSRYDPRDVEGAEPPVILVPMEGFPATVEIGPDRPAVARAWELFSLDGESSGIILLVDGRFIGVRPCGSLDSEDALAGVAWQLLMN